MAQVIVITSAGLGNFTIPAGSIIKFRYKICEYAIQDY